VFFKARKVMNATFEIASLYILRLIMEPADQDLPPKTFCNAYAGGPVDIG
jgi:hypothetical protein